VTPTAAIVTIANTAMPDITRDPLVDDLLVIKKRIDLTQHLFTEKRARNITLCGQPFGIEDVACCLPLSNREPICGECFAFVVAP
jgi:hypothetical protein